ncbi:MAG TPA: tetraacyldisaccharide 4'-kinase, partial [Burkholderiales bacterium]|nr:tetraacyldisaccharide 4'-kinase [Burkholderiales bacterium]
MPGLERCWHSPCRFLLLPFSLIFGLLAWIRRFLYDKGFIDSERFPVPVVIVGNITAGGSGKTPLVAALAAQLSSRGFHPGIISRGHGGKADYPVQVEIDSDPAVVGDEPILLRKSGFPVWVGKKRRDAARKLLEAHPRCDILIGDDGLQHYALKRDFEIAVIDGEKGFGNGLLLPAGPLREPVSRLRSVNAIVYNGGHRDFAVGNAVPKYEMNLSGNVFISIDHPAISAK